MHVDEAFVSLSAFYLQLKLPKKTAMVHLCLIGLVEKLSS